MGAMMTLHEPKDSPTLAKATELCQEKIGVSSVELERGLDGFLARVAPAKAQPRRLLRWSLAGAALASCILLTLKVSSVVRKGTPATFAPPLAYRVEGGTVLGGGYLRESGHTGMTVVFNEGSHVALSPGTRSQLRVVDRDGAHVAIERGQASFQVVHRNDRRWLVDVGPFLVTVTGTAFTVSWDPIREELDLKLRQGNVVVSGPVSAGEIALRAGQRLVANLAKAETVISEETPESSGRASPAVPAAPATDQPQPNDEPSTGAVGASRARPAPDHQWTRKLASGQWERILAEARHLGVDSVLGEASSADLFALANAARYRHQLDLARSALLAQRRRFPESSRALEATYLLGRVEESADASTARAMSWYDEYLSRAPTGPLAGDALGRKMTLTDKIEGPAHARALAEEYLRRFPKGNYAGSARELLAP
jgi:TolA-binding protein